MTTVENLFEYRFNVSCGMALHGTARLCDGLVGAWHNNTKNKAKP